MRYDTNREPSNHMSWQQGQPCSHCGQPTEVMLHRFQGGNSQWEYVAPLYHNAEKNVGFCGPKCVAGWIMVDYKRLDA